jgi:cytochrome c-type biogenesis protein
MNGLPLALAFSAGIVASVNPCGFAMLPAFVGTYLGVDDAAFGDRPPWRRLAEGISVGLAVTGGFVAVFAAIGILISLAGNVFFRQFPTIVLALGAGLVALGAWLAAGRTLTLGIRMASRAPGGRGLRPAVLYGSAYGLASLGCTLPVFLVVVGSAFSSGSVLGGLVLFLAYSAGMGLVVTGIALGAALFKGALTRWLRRALPLVQQASGGLLIAAGTYLVVRELGQARIGRSAWIDALARHAVLVGVALVAAAGLAAALLWWFAPVAERAPEAPVAGAAREEVPR